MSKETLESLLRDHQSYHSEFQIDHFILAQAGRTPWGMYRQAVRELATRLSGLQQSYLSRERLLLDIEEAGEPKSDGSIESRRKRLDAIEARANRDRLDRQIREQEREFRRFYAHAVALKQQLGELTQGKRERLEREFWMHQVKCMAALDYITARGLGKATAEILHALPTDMRREAISEVMPSDPSRMHECADRLVKWYLNDESAALPEPEFDDKLPVYDMVRGVRLLENHPTA